MKSEWGTGRKERGREGGRIEEGRKEERKLCEVGLVLWGQGLALLKARPFSVEGT